MNFIKIISIILIIIVVLNIIFFALRRISVYLFWGIILFSALMAYYGMPYLQKNSKK